jgi:5-methylcytosine-specific restriction endonuclease McrA
LDSSRHTSPTARGKSTREVERLLACLHPQPDIAANLRAVPAPRPAPIETAAPVLLELAALRLAATGLPQPVAPPAPARPVLAPLGPRSYFLKLTIGQETHDKLQRVRALLRHSVPDGDLATIVDRALTLLLKEAERTKHAEASRPRRSAKAPKITGRYVPAAVKRAVWRRDGGSCAFIGPAGRCGETAFLEFHHVVPFAEGGKTDLTNLELRCRRHNAHEAAVHGYQ